MSSATSIPGMLGVSQRERSIHGCGHHPVSKADCPMKRTNCRTKEITANMFIDPGMRTQKQAISSHICKYLKGKKSQQMHPKQPNT